MLVIVLDRLAALRRHCDGLFGGEFDAIDARVYGTARFLDYNIVRRVESAQILRFDCKLVESGGEWTRSEWEGTSKCVDSQMIVAQQQSNEDSSTSKE